MNRKQFLCAVAGAGLGETLASSCTANGRPKPAKSPLSLNILSSSIPPSEVVISPMGMPPRVLQLSPSDPHLHVVIQNVSTQPLRIWHEDNSWGYGNLTLEVSAIGSRYLPQPIKMVRAITEWLRNDATFTTLPPGEMILREVTLEIPKGHPDSSARQKRWPYKGFPLEDIGATSSFAVHSFEMRAVFAIGQDDWTQRADVWTGQIASPAHTYVLNMTNFP